MRCLGLSLGVGGASVSFEWECGKQILRFAQDDSIFGWVG